MSLDIVRHRVRIVAFGWLETLVNMHVGMQGTLAGLMGPRGGQVDLSAMGDRWKQELLKQYEGAYEPWAVKAARSLSLTCRAFDVKDPKASPDQIRVWVGRWPMFEDEVWLGRLGRRFDTAVVTRMDRETLAACLPRAARPVDHLVGSDLSRSYKPTPGFFKLLRVQLKLDEPDELLVVSAHPEVDLEPAAREGYQTLEVVREEEDPEQSNLPAIIRELG